MSTIVQKRQLNVLNPDPTAPNGGKAINDNFILIDKFLPKVASGAPGASDDALAFFEVGSRWFDTSAQTEYVCTNNAAGAATWLSLGGATGTFITGDTPAKTVTVTNGRVVSIA